MSQIIKKITSNIYHILLNDNVSCTQCSSDMVEYLDEQKLSANSKLILDTGNRLCLTHCYDDLLTAIGNFKSIAYIVADETMTHNPWTHAFVISNSTDDTRYFDNFDDAFNWCVEQG